MIDRELNLFVRQIGDGDEFVISVFEPCSGEQMDINYVYSPVGDQRFNNTLANEVLSWIDLWMAKERSKDGS